jgi:hypothetical protein
MHNLHSFEAAFAGGRSMKTEEEVRMQSCGSERDIWLIAGSMIQEYGSKAVIEASARAERCLKVSDLENSLLWKQVIRAIASVTDLDQSVLH